MGDAGGKGCLAEARRTIKQDVPKGFRPLPGGIDGDREPLVHIPLANPLAQPLRSQDAILRLLVVQRLDRRLTEFTHGYLPPRVALL